MSDSPSSVSVSLLRSTKPTLLTAVASYTEIDSTLARIAIGSSQHSRTLSLVTRRFGMGNDWEGLPPELARLVPVYKIEYAIDQGNIELMKEVLGQYPSWLNGYPLNGLDRVTSVKSSPLSDAAYNGKVELVRWLIGQGATVNLPEPFFRDSALFSAVIQARDFARPFISSRKPYFEIIQLLLAAQADPYRKSVAEGLSADEIYRLRQGAGLVETVEDMTRTGLLPRLD